MKCYVNKKLHIQQAPFQVFLLLDADQSEPTGVETINQRWSITQARCGGAAVAGRVRLAMTVLGHIGMHENKKLSGQLSDPTLNLWCPSFMKKSWLQPRTNCENMKPFRRRYIFWTPRYIRVSVTHSWGYWAGAQPIQTHISGKPFPNILIASHDINDGGRSLTVSGEYFAEERDKRSTTYRGGHF